MSAPTLSRTPVSPAALRAVRPGWRDPRFAAGVVLVALCGLLGARLLGSADDAALVWSLRDDRVAGQSLDEDDLVAVRIRFASASDADRYLSASDALAAGTVLTRDVGAGELLPRAALGGRETDRLVELPVSLPAQAVPATIAVGDLVDVWVTERGAHRSAPVLTGVPVLSLPLESTSFDAGADRQVILGLDSAAQEALPEALARMAEGSVVITSRTTR